MEGSCNTPQCVSVAAMQRFTARVAAAVHAHSTHIAVTTGAASIKWSTQRFGNGQGYYWSDAALRAAYPEGGDGSSLDFYNVHYYDWMFDPGWGYDPFQSGKTIEYWGLDKPTVVGELPPTSAHYSTAEMLENAIANGYIGHLFWAINDDDFAMEPAFEACRDFAATHAERTSHHALLQWVYSLRAPAPTPPPPSPALPPRAPPPNPPPVPPPPPHVPPPNPPLPAAPPRPPPPRPPPRAPPPPAPPAVPPPAAPPVPPRAPPPLGPCQSVAVPPPLGGTPWSTSPLQLIACTLVGFLAGTRFPAFSARMRERRAGRRTSGRERLSTRELALDTMVAEPTQSRRHVLPSRESRESDAVSTTEL
jgi:hypothetical protein